MGVITISINDRIENILRKIARTRFKKRKGYISMAITEALEEWASKKENDIISKSLKLLEEGIEMGKLKTKREDWHAR